jgi:hypothetical protein
MIAILREAKAIISIASNAVFPLYSRGFQRHTLIGTMAISHTMKQVVRASVTFSRCFTRGSHNPIVNVSGNTSQRALKNGW